MSGTKYIASNWRVPENSNSSKNDNYSLSFDGGTEVLTWGQTDLPAAHTISFWVKMGGADVDYRNILVDGVYAPGVSPDRRIYMRLGRITYFDVNSSSSTFNTTADVATILTDGDWHHVAVVRNDTVGTIYIDKVDKTDDAAIGALTTPYYLTRTGEQITSYGGTFIGDLSDICFFDYALSDPQIESLAGRPETGAGNPMALKPTPVAYYPLGDNSSGNPLTQPNVSVDDASVFDFNASSSQKITLSTCTTHSADISVSFWMKAPAQGTTNIFGGGGIFQYFGSLNTGGTLYIYDTGGSPAWKPVVGGAFDDTWHHIVITRDSGTNTIKGYKDSLLDTTTVFSNAFLNNVICRMGSYSTTRFYEGLLSQVSLYNSTIEQAEVNEIYNSGVPSDISSLNPIAWYKLDQSANWDIPLGISNEWQVGDATSDFEDSFFLNRSSFVDDIDAIPIDHAAINNISEEITVALWVKTTYSGAYTHSYFILRDQVGGAYRNFNLSKDHWYPGGTGKYVYWTVWNDADNPLVANMQSGSTAPDGSPYISIVDGKWHHVVGTYGSDTVSLYIDGILQNSNTNIGQGNIKVNVPDTTLLGRNYSSKNQGYNSGYNSNAQIWDKALTAGEVATLYNNGKPINVLSSIPQNSNLKGWWALDNTATYNSGASTWSIPDKSGNSYDITGVGMSDTVLQPGMVSALNGESSGMTSGNLVLSDLTRNLPYENYSMNFDGALEYINCGNVLDQTGSSAFSISTWVKYTSAGSICILAKQNNNQPGYSLFSVGSKIYFYLSSGTTNYIEVKTSLSINDGNWHNIITTYDGSGNASGVQIYLDGILDTTIVTDLFTTSSSNTTNLQIGARGSTIDIPFVGKISNTSIFNVELTPTEVLKLYTNGMPQDLTNFTPQPVGWWTLGKESFWNGSDWVVRDMIGSNDGTSDNMEVNDLVGDAPRSEANGTGTNMDIPTNLIGNAGFSDKNAYSINMGPSARVTDTP